ncbi:MAG TPA: SBBP repeat-containing protein [Pyrinomonadaceae bacterium]|jgi:hypothetical protein|nr:SBBP repeat-containing protein [Pyrinomonadaceae bacterium]
MLARTVNDLALDPATHSIIYAATELGVFKTTDGGSNWTSNPGSPEISFNLLLIDPANTQTIYAGADSGADAFVTKINAAGSALLFSTYLGGSREDYARGIALDASGNAYVTGLTASDDFPVANALRPVHNNDYDAFVPTPPTLRVMKRTAGRSIIRTLKQLRSSTRAA